MGERLKSPSGEKWQKCGICFHRFERGLSVQIRQLWYYDEAPLPLHGGKTHGQIRFWLLIIKLRCRKNSLVQKRGCAKFETATVHRSAGKLAQSNSYSCAALRIVCVEMDLKNDLRRVLLPVCSLCFARLTTGAILHWIVIAPLCPQCLNRMCWPSHICSAESPLSCSQLTLPSPPLFHLTARNSRFSCEFIRRDEQFAVDRTGTSSHCHKPRVDYI